MSGKGEIPPGVEEQVSPAAPVHPESRPTRPHELRCQVGTLLLCTALYALDQQTALGVRFVGNGGNSGIRLDLLITEYECCTLVSHKGAC